MDKQPKRVYQKDTAEMLRNSKSNKRQNDMTASYVKLIICLGMTDETRGRKKMMTRLELMPC